MAHTSIQLSHLAKLTFTVLLSGLASAQEGNLASSSGSKLPEIVAHRGASYDAPENTLAAFRLAWEQGADAVEGDFYVTSDGKVVCFHDRTTKRTTNGASDLAVAETTFETLRSLEVGAWKAEKWEGEQVPTLDEVLATVPEGKVILIEVKCGPEIVPGLEEAIPKSGLANEQIRIISFQKDVVAACRKAFPGIKAFWLTDFKEEEKGSGVYRPSFDSVLETLKETDASGLDCKAQDIVDEAFVKQLREAGMEFHVWTVNDPAVAQRFVELGVDSITTDRPAWLREQLTEAAADTN